MSSSAT